MSDSRALDLRLRAAVLAAGLSLASAGTARAQFVFDDAVLPPRVVAWRLADRGFTGLSRPRFDGRIYVVEAVSPSGMPVRLFVDPAVGAIVGRQPLARVETYARLERPIERPLPGFGWTEEDAAPRRTVRPLPAEEMPASRPARRPAAAAVQPPDANPHGVNPDGAARPEAPRKVARTGPARQPEPKPALRTTPEAPPTPKVAPEAARPEAKPLTTTGEGAAPADTPAKPAAEGARAEAPKPAAQEWKEPSADKRPVRVIGGPTVVPGTADKEQGAAQ